MADRVSSLIYVGDPMCSWCWGFAPEIESLAGGWTTADTIRERIASLAEAKAQ